MGGKRIRKSEEGEKGDSGRVQGRRTHFRPNYTLHTLCRILLML